MAHQPDSEPQPDPSGSDVQRSLTPDHPAFNEPLLPPSAPYLAPSEGGPTPRDSYAASNSVTNSTALLPVAREKDLADADEGDFTAKRPKPLHKKPLIWVLAAVALVLIAVAVVVPVYFTVIKPKNNSVSGGTGGSSNGGDPNNPTHNPTSSISGGNGSTITTEDGTQFTYINPFGGICMSCSNFLLARCF